MNLLLEIADEGITVANLCSQEGIELVLGDPEIGLIEICPGGSPSFGGVPAHDFETFTATNGQTVYPLLRPPVGGVLVFIRGLLQEESEYTVTPAQLIFNDGTDIVASDTVGIFYFY